MKILIAGGSGLIGSHLSRYLSEQGHEISILTRSAEGQNPGSFFKAILQNAISKFKHSSPRHQSNSLITSLSWDGRQFASTLHFDAIINLCGENIAGKRWTPSVKKRLLSSRLAPTQALVKFIEKQTSENKPHLINASAIGFYPSSTNLQTETEHTALKQNTFSQSLVEQWENCARTASQQGNTVSCLRFGVVLAKKGGMLGKLLPAFKLGLGSIIGNQNNYMSWIHIEDLCRAISLILSIDQPNHTYNLTSPQPCTQLEFSKAVAQACKKPCWLRIPSWLAKQCFGQMGEEILLANQKIYPEALLASGFKFKYEKINHAINNLIENKAKNSEILSP